MSENEAAKNENAAKKRDRESFLTAGGYHAPSGGGLVFEDALAG